MRLPIKAQVRT